MNLGAGLFSLLGLNYYTTGVTTFDRVALMLTDFSYESESSFEYLEMLSFAFLPFEIDLAGGFSLGVSLIEGVVGVSFVFSMVERYF